MYILSPECCALVGGCSSFCLYPFADKEGNEKGALGCGRKEERKKGREQASKQAIISNEYLGGKKIG
jgi:hypothetical protein